MMLIMQVFHLMDLAYRASQRIPILARVVELATSTIATFLRFNSGGFVATGLEKCNRPKKMLNLYEFEGCPFCRKVREAITVLDLDCEVRPCPKETIKVMGQCSDVSRFRKEVSALGGKQSYPFLVDDNTGKKMNQSEEIIAYLWQTYGEGAEAPLSYRLGRKFDRMPFMMLPTLFRPCLEHGMLRVPSKAPKEPLELWGCEGSPFVRLVREALCVLELPFVLRNVAHGSAAKRAEFRHKYVDKLSLPRRAAGVIQMPFLRDPNTGAELLESADIVKYLYATYQDGQMPQESWLDFPGAMKPMADGAAAATGHSKTD